MIPVITFHARETSPPHTHTTDAGAQSSSFFFLICRPVVEVIGDSTIIGGVGGTPTNLGRPTPLWAGIKGPEGEAVIGESGVGESMSF